MAGDPYRYFRVEARELLDALLKGVLALEKGAPTAQAAAELLRHAHTLKGAARVVRQPEIADHAHAIEGALDDFRDSSAPVPADRLQRSLELLDAIKARLETLPVPGETDGAPAGGQPPPERARTIRADIADVDALLDGVAEAHTQLGALRTGLRRVDEPRRLVDEIVAELGSTLAGERDGSGTVQRATTRARAAADEFRSAVATLEQTLEAHVELVDRELRQIRDAGERLRLLPAGALFTDLERAARDVAQAQAKQVVFEGVGGDVRLDAHVLAAAAGALHQIVRNAVAHGIETEGERVAAGKPARGRVCLEIARRDRHAVFACRDDGRGIDLDAVRHAARRKGSLLGETDSAGPEELMRLLLEGGISTSGTVTELSGRGIGLDVVRESALRLGGEITVTTEAGKGTTVEFEVPLSLASFDALAVETDGTVALIPLDAVAQTLRVRTDEIHLGAQGATLTHDARALPFLQLASVLSAGAAPAALNGACSVVIVHAEGGVAAIGVQRLLGTSTVVMRPLPDFAAGSAVVSGVWLDADGLPRLVLDAGGLVAEAQRRRAHSTSGDHGPRVPILVVDDSLTTRMLEQSILESAGYEVEVASSGEEGLQKAQSSEYLLFLVDVEMPGIDGFTFVERTRADPALRETPAILVTSRAAEADRQRGFDAGASAYITKGDFDQVHLLGQIRQLTGR
jgi:two-component system chemotaxis sensor kinase CheA